MNVFIVGLPLKIIVALAGSAILLPAFIALTNSLTGQMFFDLSRMMRAVGQGASGVFSLRGFRASRPRSSERLL